MVTALAWLCVVAVCCVCTGAAPAASTLEPFARPSGWSYDHVVRDGSAWDVFLCHAGPDKPVVETFALVLSVLGLRVFYDQRSIEEGQLNFGAIVNQGLFASKVVVSFVSAAYFNDTPERRAKPSLWPQQETWTALCNGIPVVPVVFGGLMDTLKGMGCSIVTSQLHHALREQHSSFQAKHTGTVGWVLQNLACLDASSSSSKAHTPSASESKTDPSQGQGQGQHALLGSVQWWLVVKRLFDVLVHGKHFGSIMRTAAATATAGGEVSNPEWEALWNVSRQQRDSTPERILSPAVFDRMVDVIRTLVVSQLPPVPFPPPPCWLVWVWVLPTVTALWWHVG